MADTAIGWTDVVWNPVTGCSKVSPGCANCYAAALAPRLARMGQEGYTDLPWTTENAAENVVLRPDRLDQPLRWRKPRRVFVNSMSDLFHELVPWEFIDQVFDAMDRCPRHTFQVLTKRPERMKAIARPVPGNVWLGTSIENDRFVGRADHLRETPAAVRFISAEPLLGPLPSLDLSGIDWLIVGGESGPKARPMDLAWLREVVDAADGAGVPVFVKQDSGRRAGQQGRIPASLWARKEWPP